MRTSKFSLILVSLLIAGSSFALLAGRRIASAQGAPTFGTISIALDYTLKGFAPIEAADVFPAGVTSLVALVCTTDMPAGKVITTQWFVDGGAETDPTNVTSAGNDCFATRLDNPNGLRQGTWEIRYVMDGSMVASKQFTIATLPAFYDIQFGADVAIIHNLIIGPTNAFAAGTKFIGITYHYVAIPDGATVSGQWVHDGQVDHEFPMNIVGNAGYGYFSLENGNGIPAGTWELRILINGQQIKSASLTVAS
ncbi:MAG: hypothetical protein KF716_01130 [Anaerolineae bacterium]|nr:hypothetical protein [Anaerolineae bacterium]